MVRVAIVEDDPSFANQLREYVERFCRENRIEAEPVLFTDGIEIAEAYRPVWDLILMDIEMPHLDGMKTAELIRKQDPSVVIIFITNMARYAIKGYEVDALDFILKPIKYPPFALKLRKAMTIIRSRRNRFLILPVKGESRRISTDDILFIEVINHVLHIHTHSEELLLRGSMQEMEEKLADLPFVRCSNSYLVNLRNVLSVRRETVVVPGHELPVSRPKRKELMQRFSDYMGGSFA